MQNFPLFFTHMLNSVGPDNIYDNDFGLCAWVRMKEEGTGLGFSENRPTFILDLFSPTEEDQEQLLKDGLNDDYWGSDSAMPKYSTLTSLRATILCFCAAINGEL